MDITELEHECTAVFMLDSKRMQELYAEDRPAFWRCLSGMAGAEVVRAETAERPVAG
jgi:hypothetical protein